MTAVELHDYERFPFHIIDAIQVICEYISRDARHELVKVCAEGIEKEKETEKSPYPPKWGVSKIMALKLKVDERTTQRWISKGIQGCNENIFKLIELSLEYSPIQTINVIQEDLESYTKSVVSILTEFYTELRQGAVGV